MKMQAVRRGESLYIYLAGELDECSVSRTREEADALIDAGTGCRIAVFNLAAVRFMDSTGIGFLMGRYKRLKTYGMEMVIEDPNPDADKILSLSGIYALIPRV